MSTTGPQFLFSFPSEDGNQEKKFYFEFSREVPASNLSLYTGYSNLGFCGFPQSLGANAGTVP
jgi:hypothetical protein